MFSELTYRWISCCNCLSAILPSSPAKKKSAHIVFALISYFQLLAQSIYFFRSWYKYFVSSGLEEIKNDNDMDEHDYSTINNKCQKSELSTIKISRLPNLIINVGLT